MCGVGYLRFYLQICVVLNVLLESRYELYLFTTGVGCLPIKYKNLNLNGYLYTNTNYMEYGACIYLMNMDWRYIL